jgi:hypothetical protein
MQLTSTNLKNKQTMKTIMTIMQNEAVTGALATILLMLCAYAVTLIQERIKA